MRRGPPSSPPAGSRSVSKAGRNSAALPTKKGDSPRVALLREPAQTFDVGFAHVGAPMLSTPLATPPRGHPSIRGSSGIPRDSSRIARRGVSLPGPPPVRHARRTPPTRCATASGRLGGGRGRMVLGHSGMPVVVWTAGIVAGPGGGWIAAGRFPTGIRENHPAHGAHPPCRPREQAAGACARLWPAEAGEVPRPTRPEAASESGSSDPADEEQGLLRRRNLFARPDGWPGRRPLAGCRRPPS